MDDEDESLWRNLPGASDYEEDSDEIDSDLEYRLYSQTHYCDSPPPQDEKPQFVATKKTPLNKTNGVIEISSTENPSSVEEVVELVSSDDEIEPYQVIGSEDVLGGSRNSRIQLSRFFTDEDSDKQCRNCRKLGHTARNCGEPPKMPPCYGCASRGHMYRDCPHKPNVGKPRWNVECGRCRRRGHMTSHCPDAWRQFRWTTVPGRMVIPDEQTTGQDKCCCNCGRMGHLAHDCRQRTMYNKIIANPFVRTFDKHTDDVRDHSAPPAVIDLRQEISPTGRKKHQKQTRDILATDYGDKKDLRDIISPKHKKKKRRDPSSSEITRQFNEKYAKEKKKIQAKSKFNFAPKDVRRQNGFPPKSQNFAPKDGKVKKKKKKFTMKKSNGNVSQYFGSDYSGYNNNYDY